MGGAPADRVRAEARRLLAAGVAGRVFPGAAACVSFREDRGRERRVEAVAGDLGGPERRAVTLDSRYDLGGLTAPVVAMAGLRLAARGALDLDAPLDATLADVRGSEVGGVTVRALLSHRSGLQESGGLYLDVPHPRGSAPARRWMLAEASRRGGAPKPTRSDLGFLLAGEALARAARVTLDGLVRTEITEPLGIAGQLLFPSALASERLQAHRRVSAYSERCAWRGEWVVGVPHDENASAVGGVAGHAGLFGTAAAVATFGRACLDGLSGDGDVFHSGEVQESLREMGDGDALRMGWTQLGPGGAVGKNVSSTAFGAVAFTGASLVCDPERDVAVALLTNRICPSRANERIEAFRPAFYDAVLSLVP